MTDPILKLTIIGASGHGKVVANIAKLNGYSEIVFLDDDLEKKKCGDYSIVGNTKGTIKKGCDYFVAVGDSGIRKRIVKELFCAGANIPILSHPNAIVADSVDIDYGSVIMPGAVVNPYSTIGKGVIINTCSSIDHDCVIGDFAHIAVGSHICGNVNIGAGTWIGAGATISNNISVCADCCIGAGAVVVNDIKQCGTYVGVPARRIR